MAEDSPAPATAHDLRLVALSGGLCFGACFVLFQTAVPAAERLGLAPSLFVSAYLATLPAMLAMAAAGLILTRRLRQHNLRMEVALNNMAQGLCMFDGNERLVICNQRYLDLYQVPAAVARPGITLTRLLEYRAANGTFERDIAAYRRDLFEPLKQGRTSTTEVRSADKRAISVINEPMPHGGWVGTHEDVTERRESERARALMQEQQQRRAAIDQAIAAFRQRVEAHLHSVGDGAMAMRTTATTLLDNSRRTTESAESAVSASNEASVNVDTAAVAADELSGSIGEIGRQLARATENVRAAVSEAQDTDSQISALAQAAKKIGDVIKLIRNIAGQTNLLALNATIEAARAGEAGKGFAVVAQEVKSLAVQTAKATEDISTLVLSVQGATGGAVQAIGRIAGRMQEIDTYANAVSASVEEQGAATDEISQNVASAAEGAKLVVNVLDAVAVAAGQTRRSAESVLTASQAVESASDELRRAVEGFLSRVAA